MKHLIFILLLLFISQSSWAQLTKEEKKALKKEIKEMQRNPEKYKALKDGIQEKKDELMRLKGDIDNVDQAINDVQQTINSKNSKEKELIDEIARLKAEKKDTESIVNNQTNIQGLVYKVQIEIDEAALYKEISEETGEKVTKFTGTIDEDGSRKYTLGYFKDRAEAETFREYLVLLRIKDAKIVPYQDGRKVVE